MAKIDREKIVRAALGSARMEGYKGSLKMKHAKKRRGASQSDTKPKTTAKR